MEKLKDIKEIIYASVKRFSSNIAFTTKIKKGEKVTYKNTTYKELLEDINGFGTSLYNIGLKKERVAILGRNRYEWVVAHLANLLGNIISVPLDKDLQLEELETSLIRSKAKAIVFDEKYIEKIEKVKERNNTQVEHFICMSELESYENVNNLIAEGKKSIGSGNQEYINAEITEKEMGILLFTSGTTSQSKAVMLSQFGIATNIHDMLLVEKFYETDVNIAFLPFHHVFGSTGMLVMLAVGLKTVFPDGLKYIKSNLKEYGVSVFIGVPVLVDKMYKTVMQEIEKQGKTKVIKIATKVSNFLLKFKIDIRRKLFKQVIEGLGGKLRTIISGGAPLDQNTSRSFDEFGIEMIQGYGLTETSPVLIAENPKKKRYGSTGIAMEHVQIEIANKDDKGIGEIRAKGPNIMLGYYENQEKTDEVLQDGWFYTGDLGYIDKDGFIFITGRKKDLIVLKNGKKVFPEEIETLVLRLPEVEECFVFGMPDEDDQNDVKVSVKVVYNESYVKDKYGKITEEELYKIIWNKIKEINTTLPKYKYMKHMILTKEPLIKTTTNKVKRNEEMKIILGK
ncbi:MAG: AMP-binding protein [Clostridia bacterium]|nr:AMP-binding protein [Clostridia bacterium]